MKNIYTVLLATSMLTACTMMPNYERPQASIPENWQQELALPEAETQAAAEIEWKNFFKSPQLQTVVEIALEHNKDLRVAVANIEAARASYNIQRADLMPNVNANVSGSKSRSPAELNGTGANVTSESYQANLASTAYELDLFGRVRSLNTAAMEDYLATVQAKDALQISLVAETANAYLQFLADKEILRLSEETLVAQQKSFNLISESQKRGAASLLDVAQVEQAVETARTNKALYQRLVGQDKNALMLLLGINDLDTAIFKGVSLKDMNLMETLPVGLPSNVLLMRPDVLQAEHQLKALNANIGAARANFFPRISLTGTLGFASSDLDRLFSGGASGAWSFAPSVNLPIFSGGRNFANLGASKANKEAAVATYEKAVQTAFKEVADELIAKETLDEQLEAQQALVNASQRAYDLSYARYQKGVDSFLNALDAQRTLFTAQQNAIDLEKERLVNLVNLYKVLGGGLK